MATLRPFFRARLLASALVLGAGAALFPAVFPGGAFIAPAQAQARFSISFNTLREELADYGDWVYSDRWGMVWLPDVGRDFHPYYTEGRWVPTREYGYIWVSDYEWGDIPFHYGRWVNDPYDGWMWVPGYMWSPGWVVWRGNPNYMGWMPLPPDDDFLRGSESISFRFSFGGRAANYDDFDDYYGYARWYGRDYDRDRFASNWVFVGADRFGERDYRPYAVRQPALIFNVFRETRNVTNYTVVNNYIVNRSADSAMPRDRASRGGAAPRPAAEVLRRPDFVRSIDSGRQVERQGSREAPRGRGVANSAPRAEADVVRNLSERTKRRGGSGRLLTRETIASSPHAAAPRADRPDQRPDQRQERAREDRGREDRGRETRERDTRANDARVNEERATQERATRERADQERANQERATQVKNQERENRERADRDRADEERRTQRDRSRQVDAERAKDSQAREERARESQARENQARESQARERGERGARESQARESQARENQARESQARESQARENRAAEERRVNEERANQQRANEQRANEQRGNEQRANEQRAEEERARRGRPAANEAPPAQPSGADETRGRGRGGNRDDDDRKAKPRRD